MPAYTFGATSADVAREIRAFGDLTSWEDDIERWMADAGVHVGVALARVGYSAEEVDGRDVTDDLRAKCARIVVLRAAADFVQSYKPDDDTIGVRCFAKAADMEKQIVDLPRAVSPSTFEESTQSRANYKTKSQNTSSRFWSTTRKI